MKKGKATIAEQSGNYGFYGKIEVECQFAINDHNLVVDLDQVSDIQKWVPGIQFGATYFFEHCKEFSGGIIFVKNIDTHEVDTSNVIIAYLTVKALENASGIMLDNSVLFDKGLRLFRFYK